MNEFYIISYDKDLGGQYFFYTGKYHKGMQPNLSIKNAKMYADADKAVLEARQLLPKVGFDHTLYVHKWTPATFMGTEIVERI